MLPAIDVRHTIRETVADLTYIQSGIGKKATVRAANTAVDRIATAASREVRKVYNVKARAVAAAMKKFKANMRGTSIVASVRFSGRNLRLIEFDARWSRNMPGASVRIKVQDARKTIPGSFIANHSRTGRAVFRRVGESRLPIKELRSVSIPGMIRNEAIHAALNTVGHTQFKKEFLRQMDLLKAQANG